MCYTCAFGPKTRTLSQEATEPSVLTDLLPVVGDGRPRQQKDQHVEGVDQVLAEAGPHAPVVMVTELGKNKQTDE